MLTTQLPFDGRLAMLGAMSVRRVEQDLELHSVFPTFGPQSGGTKANVDRWLGQFEEGRDKINAKIEEKTVGKVKITYVSAEGTYKSGMPGAAPTPKPGFALLGAIVEGEEGSVFARLTGPAALAKGAKADFEKMIESGAK